MALHDLMILFSALTLFQSCESKKPVLPEKENDAPVIVSSTPSDGASGISHEGNLTLVLTYDQDIKCLLEDQARINVDQGATIVKVNPYRERLSLTIAQLKSSTTYTLTVPDGCVKGFKEKQRAAGEASIHFTTKAALLPPTPEPYPEREENDAWRMFDRLGLGWNMGNHFDAFHNYPGAGELFLWPSETVWGCPPCTAQTFAGVRTAGFRSIRIPVTWLKTIGPAPGYKIDKAWMSRVRQAVEWARDAGLTVIINTHHDEDHYIGNEAMGHRWLNIMDAAVDESVNKKVKEQIKAFWTNVAEEFKNEGDYLIFESFNEINDGKWGGSPNSDKQSLVLNEWNQVFVEAVRATGGNNSTRWLGVPTYCASTSFIKYFVMPEDPAGRTMLAVHCYDPYAYTLAEGLPQKLWGHTLGNSYDEKNIRETMAVIHSNFISKGIPVYLGEFGCSMREYGTVEWRSYRYYLEYFVKAAATYGIPAYLWDNANEGYGSEHHAYLDHDTGKHIGHSKDLIDIMVKAMDSDDPLYTLDYVYGHAPGRQE